MEGDLITINKCLRPLSWFYGIGVGIRNMLFETGILKSRAYATPVISVGNITVGGTGKTPHVEYLIGLLKDKMNVAMLSRGYKRKTKGFVLADNNSSCKRTRGIEKLTGGEAGKDIDAIILDDAFQHRYVKPGINILLVDYHRLIIYDELLPSGRLREPVKSKDRADIVIVTKCPEDLKPMEFRVLTKAMNLYAYQQLYFSTHAYERLQPLFPKQAAAIGDGSLDTLKDTNVLLLTGIASPEQVQNDLQSRTASLQLLAFGDHHDFKAKDISRINEAFSALSSPRLIITTEKDASRLKEVDGLSDEVKKHLFALPIRIKFLLDQEEQFNQSIIGYVRKNSRNSILAKGKDEHKPKDSDHTGDGPRTISFRNY